MSELSHFEELSAITPKKGPYSILIGAAVAILALILLNILAPNEGVADLSKKKTDKPDAATATASDDGDEL